MRYVATIALAVLIATPPAADACGRRGGHGGGCQPSCQPVFCQPVCYQPVCPPTYLPPPTPLPPQPPIGPPIKPQPPVRPMPPVKPQPPVKPRPPGPKEKIKEPLTKEKVTQAAEEANEATVQPVALAEGANDALVEVNNARAQNGLPPYVYDPGLAQAASQAAATRAASLTEGHTANDFSYLPAGATARAAGCAAWPPSMGWGACATLDTGFTHAGAAYVIGRDGRRYMHAFYR